MKGWVESRFGIVPNFHRQVIGRVGDGAWIPYMTDKMSGRFDNNAIWLQLDLIAGFPEDQLRLWTSVSLELYADDISVTSGKCRRSVSCSSIRKLAVPAKLPPSRANVF